MSTAGKRLFALIMRIALLLSPMTDPRRGLVRINLVFETWFV